MLRAQGRATWPSSVSICPSFNSQSQPHAMGTSSEQATQGPCCMAHDLGKEADFFMVGGGAQQDAGHGGQQRQKELPREELCFSMLFPGPRHRARVALGVYAKQGICGCPACLPPWTAWQCLVTLTAISWGRDGVMMLWGASTCRGRRVRRAGCTALCQVTHAARQCSTGWAHGRGAAAKGSLSGTLSWVPYSAQRVGSRGCTGLLSSTCSSP